MSGVLVFRVKWEPLKLSENNWYGNLILGAQANSADTWPVLHDRDDVLTIICTSLPNRVLKVVKSDFTLLI